VKIRNYISLIFFSCLIVGSFFSSHFLTANQESFNRKEIEKYLKKAKISNRKSSGTRGDSYFVDLDDGKIERGGFLKFSYSPRPRRPIDSYTYGLAAYRIHELLDLNFIPPVVGRSVNGRKASLQILVDKYKDENERRIQKIEPPDPKKFFNSLEEIKIFEYLVYSESLCIEDDLEDIIITPEWKVWRVDFSEAFRPAPEIIKGCQISRSSKKLYQNLMKLDDKVLKSKVKKYLNKDEIDALLKRKKLIIEIIQKLIQEEGEEVVLF
jgi:hypothetical protein